jgi:hypothetical protein
MGSNLNSFIIYIKREVIMKKLFLILCVCIVSLLVFKSNAFSQDVKIRGYLQDWVYLEQQVPALKNPGVEQSQWGFRLRRARLIAESNMSDNFEAYTCFEFADAQKNLLDFRIRAKIIPEFNIAIGQFTTPGTMWETSSQPSDKIPMFELSDVAIKLSSNMGLDNYRDVGMEFYGAYSVLKYRAFIGNGNGRLFYANNNIFNRKMGQGFYGIRFDLEPVKGLSIGAHYSSNVQDSVISSNSTTPANMDRSSYSVNLNTDGFGISGLFTQFGYGNGNFKIFSSSLAASTFKNEYNGFCAMVGYKITSNIYVTGRFDAYKEKVEDAEVKNDNITVGINYAFFKEKNEIAKIGLSYQLRNESTNSYSTSSYAKYTGYFTNWNSAFNTTKGEKYDNNILLLWMQFRF